MDKVVSREQIEMARKVNFWLSTYSDVELLIKVGEYKQGADQDADVAIAKYKLINAFLKQGTDEPQAFDGTLQKLAELTR
jgi:type III secretion protein N (ATPase)